MSDPLRRLGDVEPATRTVAGEVLAHLASIDQPLPDHPETGDQVIWGEGGSSEHATGRALDFMVTGNPDVGDLIAEYVWKHRERFGLIHVIWRRRIRSRWVSPGEWRDMDDRGSPTENHMDHPHVYLDGTPVTAAPSRPGGAQSVPTPKKKHRPIPPKETLTMRLVNLRSAKRTLVRGPGVKPLQRLLDVPDDGLGGPKTRDALGDAQSAAGLTRDYIFGPKTAEALLAGKGGI